MKVKYAHKDEFKSLKHRRLDKGDRKFSLIIPARNEQDTIGKYFPAFADLVTMGHIDEIIIADSSDDDSTIDTALESASQTEPFGNMIDNYLNGDENLPVIAVNVFDPRFAGIYNGNRPVIGTAPGKGTAMYLGMTVAKGDVLFFLDADFKNIHPGFIHGLIGPFEDPETVLSKATFELEDIFEDVVKECKKQGRPVEDEPLLMKSVNARTLARPMMSILDGSLGAFPGISQFKGPLSGGCGAPREVWRSIMIPTHYGIEVSYLMQMVNRFPNGSPAYDVNLGPVEQESQDESGRVGMATNILNTILHHIRHFRPKLYDYAKKYPARFAQEYLKHAKALAVHRTDNKRIKQYADILETLLSDESSLSNTILPALDRNIYVLERGDELVYLARESTATRIIDLQRSGRRYNLDISGEDAITGSDFSKNRNCLR